MNFGIAGSGNAAHQFALMLELHGHEFRTGYARKHDGFVSSFNADEIDDPSEFEPSLDLVIVAVSDDAIADVAARIPQNLFVIHLSGMTSMNVLPQHNRGVVWPVQSLSKNIGIAYESLPFLIEASDKTHEGMLHEWFGQISRKVSVADSHQRAIAHTAAVLANNFVNHLHTLASQLLRQNNLSFDLLLPIIREEVLKLEKMTPEEAQTGPARRGDMQTIYNQLALLKEDEEVKDIYTVITNSILLKYHDKKL